MGTWLSADIPAFAVVGRVNAGKTATLATLLEIDDDELLRISATPGETTEVLPLPVRYDDEELLRFLDTPGFQQPIEAMKEIQRLAGGGVPGPAEIARFVKECRQRFPDEVRLLEPLSEGAGVIYVVDPGKPLRDSFLAEIEILRWTGRPRLALLNPQSETVPEQERQWRERLGTAFNLVRTFHAHEARYDERRRLLEALLQIEEHHREHIKKVIAAMENEMADRLEEAAEAILDFLEKALTLRVTESIETRDRGIPARMEKKRADLEVRYFKKLADLEQDCLKRVLKAYRHHLIKPDIDPARHAGLNLAMAETWRKWGLNRWQLTAAGAVAGGAAGAVFDLGVGVHSLGAGTVIGAIGGGTAAFFKGGALPELRFKGVSLGKLQSDGQALEAGPPQSPNFAWVLLDSMLIRHAGILARAHGRRDETPLEVGDQESRVRAFPAARRSLFQKWFTSCLKGSPDRGKEPEVFAELVAALGEGAALPKE
jgi:GTPase Era involved in 16S rRNA processing